ncbi:MAG: cytochrome c [Chloroflexi bacterium]|nr:cytochrome c [Chloroflexota bacterium]
MSTRFRMLSLLGVILLAVVMVIGIGGFQARPADAQSPQVERGRYLVTAGLCTECHTERAAGNPALLDRSKLLAGGEAFAGPWGVVYSSNITGLASAPAENLKRAIREGIGRGDRKLLVMPWAMYRNLAESDLDAIVAYLKSVPRIQHEVPQAALVAPRDAFYPAAAMASATGPAAPPVGGPNATAAQRIAAGAYLANAVLACTACHTPGALEGRFDPTKIGAGAANAFGPIHAPNISSDRNTGIGGWSNEDIVGAVRQGVSRDGRALWPIMPYGTAYRNLSDDDMYDVIAFLRTLPAVNNAVPRNLPFSAENAARLLAPPPQAQPTQLPRTGDGLLGLAGLAALAGAAALGAGWWLRRRHA